MSRHFRLIFNLCVLLAMFLGAPRWASALDVPEDDENDYQIPEGYTERRYALSTLLDRPQNFRMGESSFEMSYVNSLSEQQIVQIVRNCVAPESWTKHGPARIDTVNRSLVVLQKKEVHAEIEKVLQWLHEGVSPPFRATVVAVTLKPETIRKLSAAGNVPTADLLKAIEDAGEGNSETVELHGLEGQQVAAQSGQQQVYIKDFDVSGAVYDPVIDTLRQGMSASLAAYRNPDCASLQIDLRVTLASKAEMQNAKLTLGGVAAGKPGMTVKEVKKDDKGKPIDTPEKHIPAELKTAEVGADLTIDLPTQTLGGLQTSLAAPQGAFVLAGTIDFSLASETPGKLTAVFVRATVGAGKVPTLLGVSGLKDGESFRLYPLAAAQRTFPSFPVMTPVNGGFTGSLVDMAISQGAGGALTPFAQPAAPTNSTLNDTITKAQKYFAEKVRKNKLIEAMGPVLFTRLLEPDHARALQNLTDEIQRQLSPADVHAVAIALTQAAYRKLLLADATQFEAADVEALAANGGQLLVDTGVSLMPGQQAATYAGVYRNIVADYEISGDSYDPVIQRRQERAYAMDFKFRHTPLASDNEIEARFFAVPSKLAVDRVLLDSFTVNSGADTNVLLNIRADLDKVKNGVVSVLSSASAPAGKYVLAGSAQMPAAPDGKADPRQVVVFVRAGK